MANLGYIQVSRSCNQSCRFCSNPPSDAVQTLEAAQEQVDLLLERGYDGVILTGGEPTLCEFLVEIIRHAAERGLPPRMITNGQLTADRERLRAYVEAGLDQMHVSLHSCRADVQGFLSDNPDSLANLRATLRHADAMDLPVDVNTVINRYNADHLDETVEFLLAEHGNLMHFVFNNIDPRQNRASEHRDVIAQPWQFEVSLYRALTRLEGAGRTFRVERVPLCYMADFAHCSTEARKIAKGEERTVFFLDQKGEVRQTEWRYAKSEVCKDCVLDEFCPGLFEGGEYYELGQLHAVFVDADEVRRRIVG